MRETISPERNQDQEEKLRGKIVLKTREKQAGLEQSEKLGL